MKTKKLLLVWFVLGLLAGIGTKVYSAKQDGAEAAAIKEAPPYVKVSDAEAIAKAIASCRDDANLSVQLMLAEATCESFYANRATDGIKLAQQSHREQFYRAEVYPRERELETLYTTYFERYLVCLSLAAGIAFLMWCRSTLLPLLGRFYGKLRDRASLPTDLQSIAANRRVRQAEADFATLKNLHDNGLINDEMFNLRKEELKAALVSNKVFLPKDETSSAPH
jgi:hypothetical protein